MRWDMGIFNGSFVSENKVPHMLHFGVCCSLGRLQEMHEDFFVSGRAQSNNDFHVPERRKKETCWLVVWNIWIICPFSWVCRNPN
jgi:hypothetical protein